MNFTLGETLDGFLENRQALASLVLSGRIYPNQVGHLELDCQ